MTSSTEKCSQLLDKITAQTSQIFSTIKEIGNYTNVA